MFRHEHRDASIGDHPGAAASATESGQGVHNRGLIIVQIDGLSHVEFEQALDAGELPFLARLLEQERYCLHQLYSGLPSSTPAVQGELFYGVKGAVPAFAWRSRETGELHRMYDPSSAQAVERKLVEQGEPLLRGGSAYCNIYTGGAAEAHFCAASLGWSDVLQGARPHAWAVVAFLHLPTILRTGALVGLEFVLALSAAIRGVVGGHSLRRELKFVLARVAVVVLLRDLITIGAKVDIARGLPIVHLNFIGYDEQAHRRGPDTRFAHRALRGIDRRIAALWKAAHLAQHRHYDLWIYGDHGQIHTESYQERTGHSIDQALEAALSALSDNALNNATVGKASEAGESGASSRAHLLGGRYLPRLFPDARPSLNGTLHANQAQASVVGMGPIGHVLLGGPKSPDIRILEQLACWFAGPGEVPAVLFVAADHTVKACVGTAILTLPEDGEHLLGSDNPELAVSLEDLIALTRHPDAGDLVLLGWANGCRALSFAEENGSHAGASPAETVSFALLPEDALAMRDRSATTLRPMTLRQAALETLGRAGTQTASNTTEDAAPARPPTSPRVPSRRAGSREIGAGDHRSDKDECSLRVMSYNVHGCVGMDGRLAPERIARVIARHSPDVIALQELDVGRSRSNRTDQTATIAAILEMEHRFHPAMHVEEGAYGNALLTRLPVLAHREGLLTGPQTRRFAEPRGALWITLELDGCEVQVLNTHLGLRPAERREQVQELLSSRWLGHPDCIGPTILCGDMNASAGSWPLNRLCERLSDAREAPLVRKRTATFPTRGPMLSIDHVLTRGVAGVDRIFVPGTELERLASDHFPLVVDLRMCVQTDVSRSNSSTSTPFNDV